MKLVITVDKPEPQYRKVLAQQMKKLELEKCIVLAQKIIDIQGGRGHLRSIEAQLGAFIRGVSPWPTSMIPALNTALELEDGFIANANRIARDQVMHLRPKLDLREALKEVPNNISSLGDILLLIAEKEAKAKRTVVEKP